MLDNPNKHLTVNSEGSLMLKCNVMPSHYSSSHDSVYTHVYPSLRDKVSVGKCQGRIYLLKIEMT